MLLLDVALLDGLLSGDGADGFVYVGRRPAGTKALAAWRANSMTPRLSRAGFEPRSVNVSQFRRIDRWFSGFPMPAALRAV